MAVTVSVEKCPMCGANVHAGMSNCEFCDSPLTFQNLAELDSMSAPKVNKYANAYASMLAEDPANEAVAISLGLCFMKLKLFDKAYAAFDKAISAYTENPDVYYYTAVCVLGGKKAFLAGKANVDKAMQMLQIANDCEPRGIFYYFDAYLRFDFYKRKALNIQPPYTASLQKAQRLGCSSADVTRLFDLLGVEVPMELASSISLT